MLRSTSVSVIPNTLDTWAYVDADSRPQVPSLIVASVLGSTIRPAPIRTTSRSYPSAAGRGTRRSDLIAFDWIQTAALPTTSAAMTTTAATRPIQCGMVILAIGARW